MFACYTTEKNIEHRWDNYRYINVFNRTYLVGDENHAQLVSLLIVYV